MFADYGSPRQAAATPISGVALSHVLTAFWLGAIKGGIGLGASKVAQIARYATDL